MESRAKSVIRILFTIIISLAIFAFSYQDKNPHLEGFVKEIFKSYRLPPSVLRDCKWNYAILVVRTNSKNEIVKIDFANHDEISDEFKNSFQYLKGYIFPKSIKINQPPIVLFLTVEQLGGMGCSTPERNYSPSIVAQKILMNIEEHLKREPNSIIKYNPIIQVAGGRVN